MEKIFMDHAAGAASMREFFPGLGENDLPGGLGWAVEFLRLTTHSGSSAGCG